MFLACDSLKLLSIYFDLCVDTTGVLRNHLGLLGTDLHAIGCRDFVKTLSIIIIIKGLKLSCVVSVFPLGPHHSQLRRVRVRYERDVPKSLRTKSKRSR